MRYAFMVILAIMVNGIGFCSECETSNVVFFVEQIKKDLTLPDSEIWAHKSSKDRIETCLSGLCSITNGMKESTVIGLMGLPDRKVRVPDKAAPSKRGSYTIDYYLKKKSLNTANVKDWIVTLGFTKASEVRFLLYQNTLGTKRFEFANHEND